LDHHPVISHFRPFNGLVRPFTHVDFLGSVARHEFLAGFCNGCSEPALVENRYPEFDDEYFEWIDLLKAVASAKGSFTMIEVGAGFGRWSVCAALAIRQFDKNLPYRLIAVEAEPLTFQWMRSHFRDNDVDPDQHHLINAAVSDRPGSVQFYVGGPPNGPVEYKPGTWYGQALTKDYDASAKSKSDGTYHGFQALRHASGWRSIWAPTVDLRSVVHQSKSQHVDLIDIDIEGEELAAVSGAIRELDGKVKRLHIGTHTSEVEAGLRRLLSEHGWICEADYPLLTTSETPWGPIRFQDGVQSWVNPRLE
jgi:FkbM family methyltransferase